MRPASDYAREPWKHPAAWRAHVVRTTLGHVAGVDFSTASCECGWCACARTDRDGGRASLDDAKADHWRSVIAEAEAALVPA